MFLGRVGDAAGTVSKNWIFGMKQPNISYAVLYGQAEWKF